MDSGYHFLSILSPWWCRSHPRVLWSQSRSHVLLAVQLRGCKQKEVKLGSRSVELWWGVVSFSLSLHNLPLLPLTFFIHLLLVHCNVWSHIRKCCHKRFRSQWTSEKWLVPVFRTFLCTWCRLAVSIPDIAIDLMCDTTSLALATCARLHHAFILCLFLYRALVPPQNYGFSLTLYNDIDLQVSRYLSFHTTYMVGCVMTLYLMYICGSPR